MSPATSLQVLGIDVPAGLLDRWAQWLAPPRQPFLVDPEDPLGGDEATTVSRELTDTFELYGLSARPIRLVWLSEAAFGDLTRSQRAALVRSQVRQGRGAVPTVRRWRGALGSGIQRQGDGHRFVWWPSVLARQRDLVLSAFVTNDRLPSAHRDVPLEVWRRAGQLLPNARRLAGRFPNGSGPNCFGTVMAVTGVHGADQEWMQREPFEAWLATATRPGGRDDEAGTVFVWRGADGRADHAAVTIGAGWAMHKPSQGWMSPTKVLTVDDVKRRGRLRGLRLHRYGIHPRV